MNELKKCPFCGGEAFVRKNKDVMETFTAYCGNADCPVSPKVSAYGKDMAINLWNTRIPMQNIVKRLEEELRLAKEERDRCVIKALPYYDNVRGYATGMHHAIQILKEILNE